MSKEVHSWTRIVIKIKGTEHALAISQFLDAKIRLRNRAEPGTFGGVCARSRLNYEPGILGGGAGILGGEEASLLLPPKKS